MNNTLLADDIKAFQQAFIPNIPGRHGFSQRRRAVIIIEQTQPL